MKNKDLWDDTLLIKAYDESIRLAKEQVAKKIANSTNSVTQEEEAAAGVYKIGDYCRATWNDGIDYEAKVVGTRKDDDVCYLKFIGYNDEKIANISDLLPSWGKVVRKQQSVDANASSMIVEGSESCDESDFSNEGAKKKSRRYGKSKNKVNFAAHCAPSYNKATKMPQPPPMPPVFNEDSEDSENLSAMLMSWYMSGYYTGYYQGIKDGRNEKRSKTKK